MTDAVMGWVLIQLVSDVLTAWFNGSNYIYVN